MKRTLVISYWVLSILLVAVILAIVIAVIAAALAKGSSAVLPLQYLCDGCSTYGGNAIITGYSEDSSGEVDSDTTLNLDLKITGDFEIVT